MPVRNWWESRRRTRLDMEFGTRPLKARTEHKPRRLPPSLSQPTDRTFLLLLNPVTCPGPCAELQEEDQGACGQSGRGLTPRNKTSHIKACADQPYNNGLRTPPRRESITHSTPICVLICVDCSRNRPLYHRASLANTFPTNLGVKKAATSTQLNSRIFTSLSISLRQVISSPLQQQEVDLEAHGSSGFNAARAAWEAVRYQIPGARPV